MPRLVFKKIDDFKTWVSQFVYEKRGRYQLFYTDAGEIIAHPIVTSKPIIVGYISGVTNVKTCAEDLGKTVGIPVYGLEKIEWDTERGPGRG